MNNTTLLIYIIFITGFARAQLDGTFGDLDPFIVDKDEVGIEKDSYERKILDNDFILRSPL